MGDIIIKKKIRHESYVSFSRSLAAARRMAGKKGAAVALQTEVNTDEDFQKLLEKEGLIVVDVYSEWCGPCLGMVGNLKKLKLEIGSDYLHLAIAKSDTIEALARFRNKSEPTWMFIGSGELLDVMFGANAPQLMRRIQTELSKELSAMKGEIIRSGLPLHEMTEIEKERAKLIQDKEDAERQRAEKEKADKLEDLKIKSLTKLARKLPTHTLSLYFPHMIEGEKRTCNAAFKMMHHYDSIQLMIIDQQDVQLSEEDLPELFYNSDFEMPPKFKESITLKPCLVTLVLGIASSSVDSKSSIMDILGKVEATLGELIYGKLDHNNPVANTPAANYQTVVDDEVWPGIWTPLNYLSKAAAIKVLFPSVVRAIGHEDDKLPPPMYVIIFEATRAREVNEMVEEFPGEVLKVGYFDSAEAETAKKVCRNIRDLERMGSDKIKGTKMVLSLAKTSSDPLLMFSQLNPIYISPDLKIGTKEAEMFFPPDEIEEEEGEETDEDEDYEEEEYTMDREYDIKQVPVLTVTTGDVMSTVTDEIPQLGEVSRVDTEEQGLATDLHGEEEGEGEGDERPTELVISGEEGEEEGEGEGEGEEGEGEGEGEEGEEEKGEDENEEVVEAGVSEVTESQSEEPQLSEGEG
ncbi:uncharacterized protein LOC142326588 [Lycorma delicatula]|uniref:uncharacterized protein LOC142326588 n=1 Tax=Lycorma delicatula TaxID=130591 RepID=UPI003F5100F3